MKIRAGSPSLYLTAGEARGQVPPDNMSCGAAMSFVPYYYIAAPQLTREFHAAIHGLAPVVIDNLVPSALHPSPPHTITSPSSCTIRRRALHGAPLQSWLSSACNIPRRG
ncbi:MAG: hypothetical protein HDR90_08280 [Bacteroides sp.]|nr:hypothetical protein [Bacteroides sp.]